MKRPDGQHPSIRIGPSGREALQLLACCPRVPTDVVAALLGLQHGRSAAQLLARLRHSGLARYQATSLGPLLGSRRVRLWTVTPAGQALLDTRGPGRSAAADGHLPYGDPERRPESARGHDLPLQIAAYQLLARAVRDTARPVRVVAWEHPWIRPFGPAVGERRRHTRLPAAAVLIEPHADADRRVLRLLLVPDLGTAPLFSYRAALRGLIQLRQTAGLDEADEPLLLVGVATPRAASARAEAWRSLLDQVAYAAGDRLLRARVLARETGSAGAAGRRGQADEVFALVARHPLVTRHHLASLLGTSATRVARLQTELVERGWVQPIRQEKRPHTTEEPPRHELERLGLLDLTPAGRREAARRLMVPAGLARRRHGVIASESGTRHFVRHLHHTLGANAVFVELAAAAARVTSHGGHDALVEWRSAAACARGRFRPDGYGCYRRGKWRFGFFLEYDRGTERSMQYAAKLAIYYRFRASGAYKRDYQGFPTLLIVTTSDRAEARLAHLAYLAHQRFGGTPLGIFLTTTSRIEACPEAGLGRIWRSPVDPWAAEPQRICWLPAAPG